MDDKQRKICAHLRELPSSEAADWLLERYPAGGDDWGEALRVMPHLSWEKRDQVRLATHYLSRIPFASARGYEVFASFMSVPSLIGVIRAFVPSSEEDRRLLEYHLSPVLRRKAESDKDVAAVRSFLDSLA